MKWKVLKNKKYYIPTTLIEEAKQSAKELDEEESKIKQMTDSEYEKYLEKELVEAHEELEKEIVNETTIPYEIVMKDIEEQMNLLDKQIKNKEKWENLLKEYRERKVVKLRYTI